MPVTTSAVLSLALPSIIASARLFNEYDPVVPRTVDRKPQTRGTGLDWTEIRVGQLTATGITETTILDNPQANTLTTFSIRPTMIGIQTLVTDRTLRKISANVGGLLGSATGRAMSRRLDTDGIAVYATATTTLAGTAVTLSGGHISAGVSRIHGNATETGMDEGPINVVIHPFGVKDLADEVRSGIGTYPVPAGMSAEMFTQGWRGQTIDGANIWVDGNIAIVANDARGGMSAKNGIVLVEGMSLKTETRRRPDVGGGSEEMFMYHEYAYGIRSQNWIFGLLHDATAPTS